MLATELQSLDDQSLIETIALEAGKIALKHFKKEPEVWYKGITKSPVSEADLEIDDYLKKTLLEARNGCGVGRNEPCDGVKDVSFPTLTPFLVSNGTGAAIIIAPGGGYQHLAFSKEGLDIARMYNALGVSGKAAAWYERTDRCPLAAFVLKYRVPARPQLPG